MNGEWDVLEHDEGVRDGNAGEEEVDRLAEMEKAANLHEFLSEVGNCCFPVCNYFFLSLDTDAKLWISILNKLLFCKIFPGSIFLSRTFLIEIFLGGISLRRICLGKIYLREIFLGRIFLAINFMTPSIQ